MAEPLTQRRGRFAPSPSGPLHFGSLVAATGSYLDARRQGGEWLVRIEDIDPPREKPEAAADILRTLEAFGFEWDGPVLYQSTRAEAYRATLEVLVHEGLAYPCACSRREIAKYGLAGMEGPRYPGTCRSGPNDSRTPRSIRVRTHGTPLRFRDRICGEVAQNLEQAFGDFVVRRADGLFAYQLAVVLDDAFQEVTDVVRGADLLYSTPRQIHLQRLLGLPTPAYAHLPLVRDDAGTKLSKQSKAQPVSRNDPLPALLAALRFLNQPLPTDEPVDLEEFWDWALSRWQPGRVPATRSVAEE